MCLDPIKDTPIASMLKNLFAATLSFAKVVFWDFSFLFKEFIILRWDAEKFRLDSVE